ncbi:MAG: hypothetical protein COT15_02890 [Candidatus Diapherotrites archaeon CG08_land_8_20_14_0_20_34_12]|nr:MAG: hypothetical protein COT15_02890 [Candidatus Diapherotrites archaeon CG08_land_8_20_14_0_20_34_12]
MNYNKKILIGIIAIIAFLYAIFGFGSFLLEHSLSASCPLEKTASGKCVHEEQLDFLIGIMPLVVSIALGIGAAVYYLMSSKLEKKDKTLKSNTDVLLKFLSPDEKKVINKLIENKGRALQAEVTRLPDMGKVKSHRAVMKLIDKGVIEKESMGKTNIIKFKKEIQDGLL